MTDRASKGRTSFEDKIVDAMRGLAPGNKTDAATVASGKTSFGTGKIEPPREGRTPAKRGETLADRIKRMDGFAEATARVAPQPEPETAQPVTAESKAAAEDSVMDAARSLLRAGSPRGFERDKRERYERREQARRELIAQATTKPVKLGREQRVERWREWAREATPEARYALLTSDQYENASEAAKAIIAEALGQVERETPSAEETEAVENYIAYGNTGGFQDYGEDDEDDEFQLARLEDELAEGDTGNYVDKDGNEHTDQELLNAAAAYRPQHEA
jgi:hypothetical protein